MSNKQERPNWFKTKNENTYNNLVTAIATQATELINGLVQQKLANLKVTTARLANHSDDPNVKKLQEQIELLNIKYGKGISFKH